MEELFQLAGLNKLAATSTFGLKVSSIVPESENLSRIVNIVGDAEVGVSPKSEEESRKIFIPVLINGFRVAGHLDSGSDVSIMQFSLFLKLRKATKNSFDRLKESMVKNLTSFSGNQIPVKGEISVNLKFSGGLSSTRFRIYVIHDISDTPLFFLGMIC